jgi:hypothetical protein
MPEPQMKISAALPTDDAGKNASVVAWSTTEIEGLLRRVFSSTPRVRMELASHDIAMTAQRTKPRRNHRRHVGALRLVMATASVIVDS